MADDPVNSVSTITVLLGIWGALGPVLTAGVTAWWNRRNELKDRGYYQEREESQKKIEANRLLVKEKISILEREILLEKNAIIQFNSNAVDHFNGSFFAFVRIFEKQGLLDSKDVEANAQLVKELNNSYAELKLLLPEGDLVSSANELLKFCTSIQVYELTIENSKHLSKQFVDLKTNFLTKGKVVLDIKRERIRQIYSSLSETKKQNTR